MRLSSFFVRKEVSSIRHPQPRRRPLVEALEGRQLLSTFTATEFKWPSAQSAVVGSHIGSNAVVGSHIGYSEVVGSHVGTNMAIDAGMPNGGIPRKH